MFFIMMKRRMIDGVEETIQSSFNFRGVGDFTFNCGTGHFRVIISRLVRTSAAVYGGGNIFRARGVLDLLRGTRVGPLVVRQRG